jgi:hypothetical protein
MKTGCVSQGMVQIVFMVPFYQITDSLCNHTSSVYAVRGLSVTFLELLREPLLPASQVVKTLTTDSVDSACEQTFDV